MSIYTIGRWRGRGGSGAGVPVLSQPPARQ
jgi:hypothetical protein